MNPIKKNGEMDTMLVVRHSNQESVPVRSAFLDFQVMLVVCTMCSLRAHVFVCVWTREETLILYFSIFCPTMVTIGEDLSSVVLMFTKAHTHMYARMYLSCLVCVGCIGHFVVWP